MQQWPPNGLGFVSLSYCLIWNSTFIILTKTNILSPRVHPLGSDQTTRPVGSSKEKIKNDMLQNSTQMKQKVRMWRKCINFVKLVPLYFVVWYQNILGNINTPKGQFPIYHPVKNWPPQIFIGSPLSCRNYVQLHEMWGVANILCRTNMQTLKKSSTKTFFITIKYDWIINHGPVNLFSLHFNLFKIKVSPFFHRRDWV